MRTTRSSTIRTTRPLRRVTALVGAGVFLAGLVSGCGSDPGGTTAESSTSTASTSSTIGDRPTVTDAWVRTSTAGMNTAAYMSINGGTSDDELVGVSVAGHLAEVVEIHETLSDGPHSGPSSQMKKMQRIDKIRVPAGESVELAPGGYHVMLKNLHQDVRNGDSVDLTLNFRTAGDVAVTAEVREM